eukprot:TRINITY_DN3449_c0_g2_i1.p1 TRINITY_DN3449_c0_g2~~TRINITY_DN3449_c0_g2_i1.p1  ORF type:complete len:109 (-),score=1.57 TRINITY_DN3449_c0_g2_i1:106-432(-)
MIARDFGQRVEEVDDDVHRVRLRHRGVLHQFKKVHIRLDLYVCNLGCHLQSTAVSSINVKGYIVRPRNQILGKFHTSLACVLYDSLIGGDKMIPCLVATVFVAAHCIV